MATVIAALDVAAENRRAANLDRGHDAALSEVHMAGIGRTPRLAMAAEDVRYLKLQF